VQQPNDQDGGEHHDGDLDVPRQLPTAIVPPLILLTTSIAVIVVAIISPAAVYAKVIVRVSHERKLYQLHRKP